MGSLAAGAAGALGRDARCAAGRELGLWSRSTAMLRERGLGGSCVGGLELEAALVSPQPCSPRCAEPAAAESSPRFSLRLVKPSLEAGPAGAAVAQRSHLGCSFPERGLSPRGARARLRGCLPTCAGQGKAPRVFSASRCEREPLAELKGKRSLTGWGGAVAL